MKILFAVLGECILLTDCPNGYKFGIGFDIIKVGSDQCKQCEFNRGTDEVKKEVDCIKL